MKKVAFIIHGKLRTKEKLQQQILQHFSEGYKVQFLITQQPGHSISLAKQAALDGYTYIICCGGDGSLNECANGIMQSGLADKEEIKLGLLPGGSGNDFIKTIKSASTVQELKNTIEHNKSKRIDLGLARFTSTDGKDTSRYFINITDVGMGGVAVERLNRTTKMFGAMAAYQYAIVTSLISYKKHPITVTGDTFTCQGRMMNFFAANGAWLGSGLGVSPDSSLDDGLLNAIAIGDVSVMDYLKYLPDIRKGKKIIHPEVHYHTCKELTIQSSVGPLPIDMDGEFVGYSPMKVKVIPAAINFIV
ncbi:MAG: diacylglycerol kinase family protein [Chitinophagales bacterium]